MRRMVKKGSSSQSCSSPRLLIAGSTGSKWRWGLELITDESLESDLDHQHALDLPKIIGFVCFPVDVETGRQWKFKTRSFFKVPVITAAPRQAFTQTASKCCVWERSWKLFRDLRNKQKRCIPLFSAALSPLEDLRAALYLYLALSKQLRWRVWWVICFMAAVNWRGLISSYINIKLEGEKCWLNSMTITWHHYRCSDVNVFWRKCGNFVHFNTSVPLNVASKDILF